MKYGGSAGTDAVHLTMTATTDGPVARIAIADRGEGIAPENRQRVLDRFVRLDESRSKPGNGLGLSLVASLMKLHGGSVDMSDAGPGLKVTLTLPLRV
jgi:signal transduction histidine kinase